MYSWKSVYISDFRYALYTGDFCIHEKQFRE